MARPSESGKCYGCQHRRDLPGDAHSRCAHPVVETMALASAIVAMHQGGDFRAGPAHVQFARHGVLNGWAMWPLNFDPVWLEACNLYAAREVAA